MPAADDRSRINRLVAATPAHPGALLELCSVPGGHGADILAHNPALAVLAVHAARSRMVRGQPAPLRRLATLPWRELLAALGLPARPRTLRLLRKVPRDHCRPPTLEALRRVLAKGGHRWIHALPHLAAITRDTVGLLRLDPSLVTPELLRASTASDCDEETLTWLLTSIRSSLLQLGHRGPWPYRGVGLDKLKLIEGELYAQLHPQPLEFSKPPLVGRPGWIEPLCDLFALAREAEEQGNHAIIALLPEILLGEAFVYAVHRPERATLVLRRRNELHHWSVHELCGPRATAPAPAARAFVEAWLAAGKSTVPDN